MTGSPPEREPVSRAHADTNVVIALLAGPAHPLHDEALSLFRRVADGTLELVVSPVIVAEVFYIIRRVLKFGRVDASERLRSFLAADGMKVREERVVERALEIVAARSIDFPDAYLAALAQESEPRAIASFDRDLGGIEGVRRIAS